MKIVSDVQVHSVNDFALKGDQQDTLTNVDTAIGWLKKNNGDQLSSSDSEESTCKNVSQTLSKLKAKKLNRVVKKSQRKRKEVEKEKNLIVDFD